MDPLRYALGLSLMFLSLLVMTLVAHFALPTAPSGDRSEPDSEE